MSVLPGFGSWINQNIEEPPEAESKSPKSEAVWAVDTKYYDLDEVRREGEIWRAAEEKHPWYDAPAKVKVTTKNGLCHMNIEFKLGLPPEGVYEMFTNPNNYPVFKKDKAGRQRLENKSRKVLKKNGPRQTTEMEKDLYWNFLFISRTIPIHLVIDENHKNLTLESGARLCRSGTLQHTNLKPWYDEPGKTESMEPGHPRSKALYVVDPKYYDLREVKRQVELWIVAKNKHPWYDATAKVKVKTKKGLCHMKIEFTLGWPPQAVYEMLTNPRNLPFFREDETGQLLENKSTKVLKKDGPRQITDVEKALRWKVLWWSGIIPIHLIIDENHQNLSAKYKKEKMKFMKVFEGSWKVEPLYVDQERFCKSRSVNSQEEYKKCSGGRGRIASMVTMELIFQPSTLLNLPPVSWIIRGITIKITKMLLEDLRKYVIMIHKSDVTT
ncbi:unnamed protein product [Arabidopsis thaliana]|uniref:DUF220 domain-containing protein n=2 Tax=Arabidopsis thaliana TaxID=3702 RepID=A0A5S9VR36_ARATH|nr:unnamed protein product [Arabidopsis thaliana]